MNLNEEFRIEKTRSEVADDGCTGNISLQALAQFESSVWSNFHQLGPIILFLLELFNSIHWYK